MKKMFVIISLSIYLSITATVSFAASAKCEVVETKDNLLLIDCGKKTKKFAPGSKIKIKSVKEKQIEGC